MSTRTSSPVKSVRIPLGLDVKLDEAAEEQCRTRSGQLVFYLRRGLAQDGKLPPDGRS